MAVKTIRPPAPEDWTLFLRTLFLRTERQIVDEITRKRAGGDSVSFKHMTLPTSGLGVVSV